MIRFALPVFVWLSVLNPPSLITAPTHVAGLYFRVAAPAWIQCDGLDHSSWSSNMIAWTEGRNCSGNDSVCFPLQSIHSSSRA
jgi:hypothetical protein